MKISEKKKRTDEWEQLRAGLIFRTPNLFNLATKSIDQIYALINTYIVRKDYQVIRNGLNALYSIVFKYIEIRQGTFFPPVPFLVPASGEPDLSHDPFLNDVFEKLAALQRVASKEKDLELSEDALECLTKIAIKCVDIRYRVNTTGEHHHCMLAVQYMQQNIEDCLNTGLLDIGISGSLSLRNIGVLLMDKNDSTGIRMIIKNLSKIAMYGIAKSNASFLISYPLQAYSVFIRAFVFNKKYYDEFLPQTIFEEIQNIADMYVQFKEPPRRTISTDLQYALGPFIDLSNRIAMPHIFDEAYNKIIDKKIVDDEKQSIMGKIIDLGYEVWHFYDALSKSAAKKESFLIHFIDANIHHIAKTLTYFCQLHDLGEGKKKEIRENIRWIISNYWRIYHYHEKITAVYEMQMFDNLLELGSKFYELSFLEEAGSLIDIIVSIANSFLEKKKDGYGFDPARILARAAYLCILFDSTTLNKKFVDLVNKDFWVKYIKEYPQHKELLFRELLKIDPERIRLEGPHISFESRFLEKLDRKKIEEFVVFLKKNLKTEEK